MLLLLLKLVEEAWINFNAICCFLFPSLISRSNHIVTTQMEVPSVEVTNATPNCKCSCHEDEEREKAYRLRKRHCENCNLVVSRWNIF